MELSTHELLLIKSVEEFKTMLQSKGVTFAAKIFQDDIAQINIAASQAWKIFGKIGRRKKGQYRLYYLSCVEAVIMINNGYHAASRNRSNRRHTTAKLLYCDKEHEASLNKLLLNMSNSDCYEGHTVIEMEKMIRDFCSSFALQKVS